MVSHLILLSAVAGIAAAVAVPQTHALHEKRDHVLQPSRLVKKSRVHSAVTLPVRIGLKQRNLDLGHDWLMDVTDPASANYAKFWSSDDVVKAFEPLDETVENVKSWLVSHGGIPVEKITHSDNKAWIAVDMPATTAEKLFHTTYHTYEHSGSGNSYVGCDEYHIPMALQSHIDYITPGVKTVKVKKTLEKRGRKLSEFGKGEPLRQAVAPSKALNKTSLEACSTFVTPACLRALYRFSAPNANATVNPSNAIGVFEEGDTYAQGDLDAFFTNFTLGANRIPNGTHPTLDLIDGAVAPVPLEDAGGESDLDFELIYPIVYPQSVTLYQTDDPYYASGASNATGIFNTFFDALDGSYCTYCAYGECGNDPTLDPSYPDPQPGGFSGQLQCGVFKPTNVITISYGEQESDLPAYYQQRQCNEFLKLGLQGVSIFVASGDTGVSGYPNSTSPNGCLGPQDKIFSPTQPNSCPYLTNVGGTQVTTSVNDPESAFAIVSHSTGYVYSSGGGFSNIFTIPKYQQAAVSKYFAEHNPPYPYYFNGQYNTSTNGIYNRNGRGIPDVAAVGANLAIYNEGELVTEGGTSASSPIFASLINRIVEERLKIGKGPLGLINPALYAHPEVLNDITNGTNPGCGTPGFSAVKGWDPVTGLGTPNYPKMLKLFLSLP